MRKDKERLENTWSDATEEQPTSSFSSSSSAAPSQAIFGASLTAQTLSRFNNAKSGSFKVQTSDDDVLSLCPSEFLPP